MRLAAITLVLLVGLGELAQRLGVPRARLRTLGLAVVVALGALAGGWVPIAVDVGIVAGLGALYLPLVQLAWIARDLERSKRSGSVVVFATGGRRPHVVLAAAVRLANAGFWRDASLVVDTIGGAHPRVLLQSAMTKIALGDLAAARARLAQIPNPARADVATVKRITEARILAQEGRGAEALALLGPTVPASSAIAVYARVVRAHAHAADGDREGARLALREVDARELARAAAGNGPAAPIAAELIAGTAAPYR